MNIARSKIAILATNGFEQSELLVPLRRLKEVGAQVDIVSPEEEKIRGWNGDDWGGNVDVDVNLSDADPDDYDALVLPGGQINPDLLRVNEKAVQFVRAFAKSGRPIAAICHAPWLLIEADIARGLRATSYQSIKKDMMNAGAEWVDEPAVVDRNIVTSRNPGDLDSFCSSIIEVMERSATPQHHAAE
ncbi:Intracellular protease 1 [Candidatus Filomicrobium marinum]|nr:MULTISPECIES: type 1 glutamine amidotransferase domain-containing protein [Filomicrobium]MCV0370455.1 type 1 glutamine amidotransferase [Filomicrobium sp.]CFX09011.1 Intracellular protease 1 [Candidatus Filomicrobium marinum]SDO43107.1 protease I [Filomicrobium insigne]